MPLSETAGQDQSVALAHGAPMLAYHVMEGVAGIVHDGQQFEQLSFCHYVLQCSHLRANDVTSLLDKLI